ncbi:hypothetical protein NDU88_002177 [Pleurodeles waltl]|uniref:Uncharacterized protein n=1 Tax=Pleurodeles waltl TaxID=8319 RepID=A0AAV7T1D1_PLEWA|nr:hypothetical protein NDU88_002177 [Pleurodeles waltl]
MRAGTSRTAAGTGRKCSESATNVVAIKDRLKRGLTGPPAVIGSAGQQGQIERPRIEEHMQTRGVERNMRTEGGLPLPCLVDSPVCQLVAGCWAEQGTQQRKMDKFTAPSTSGGTQVDRGNRPQDTSEPSGVQILAAVEALSGMAVQAKLEATAILVNLPSTELHKVAERSVETKNQAREMQEEVTTFRAQRTELETHTHR